MEFWKYLEANVYHKFKFFCKHTFVFIQFLLKVLMNFAQVSVCLVRILVLWYCHEFLAGIGYEFEVV